MHPLLILERASHLFIPLFIKLYLPLIQRLENRFPDTPIGWLGHLALHLIIARLWYTPQILQIPEDPDFTWRMIEGTRTLGYWAFLERTKMWEVVRTLHLDARMDTLLWTRRADIERIRRRWVGTLEAAQEEEEPAQEEEEPAQEEEGSVQEEW